MSAHAFRPNRNRIKFEEEPKKKRFTGKPATHGRGAAALSFLGAGLFILGIVFTAMSDNGMSFWVLGALAVQLWIVAALMRPIEAIWTLLDERLPKR